MKKNKTKALICATVILLMAVFLLSPSLSLALEDSQKNIFVNATVNTSAESISDAQTKTVLRSENPVVFKEDDLTSENTSAAKHSEDLEFPDENRTRFQKIKKYFSASTGILAYGVVQNPADSIVNPHNDLLELPGYVANFEIRPDLYFDSDYLELSVKPRGKIDFQAWEEGMREDDTEWGDDWYINEWLVRANAWHKIFLSYGRENLQWGPSFLFSPSNPFFADNGRVHAYMEVPGMDFGRLVFIPHLNWAFSLIVNTDEGRSLPLGPDPFHTVYAVKMDYTGEKAYGSLIYSRKEFMQTNTFGFFGGWTASDALLLYTEGSMRKGSDAYYPVEDTSSFGASLQRIDSDDRAIKPTILAGGAYTFENSGTLTLEYLYNGQGYSRDEADLYFTTARKVADFYNDLLQNAASDSEREDLAGMFQKNASLQNSSSGLRFLRKNYAMLQYHQVNIQNRFNITLRWTQNIDDGSGQLFGLFSYIMGNHWELFSSGLMHAGDEETEFGSVLDYQVMLGLKFTL